MRDWNGCDREQVQLIEVDRVLAVDAGVRGPEGDLTGPGIDEPPVSVIGLIRKCSRDLVHVERVQIEHARSLIGR